MNAADRLALWTTPAAELGPAKDQTAASSWVKFGRNTQWTQPAALPRLALTMRAWSWPIYDGSKATRRIRCWRSPACWDEPARWTTMPATKWPALLPWADGWRPASEGEDGGILIDDDATGVEGWEALNLRPASWFDLIALAFRTGFQAKPGDWVADQLARRTRQNAGFYVGRGMGAVPKRTGILTADEVLSGRIGHALAVTGLTQWGPGARYVAPATRVEHPAGPSKAHPPLSRPGDDPRLMPHGTRLALAITDDEIAAWIAQRRHTGATAQTATTIVRCLREFGMIVAETGGETSIECSGSVGPDRDLWRSLGVTDPGGATLLDGLPWSSRLYVVGTGS